jgi:hypothetical protein
MIDWIKNPYNTNTLVGFGHDESNYLILTHAFFMGREIISPKGARREIKLSRNIYILNG